MTVKVLTEHHLEFLSLRGGSIGSSESTLVKIPHCSKSHVMHRKEWRKVQQVHYTPSTTQDMTLDFQQIPCVYVLAFTPLCGASCGNARLQNVPN